MVITEAVCTFLITWIALVGLFSSNVLYDRGVPQYLSRKVGHGTGGLGYLLCALLFSSPFLPIIISGGFTILLLWANLFRPSTFRGVGGSARKHAVAEVWFPLAGTFSLAVGWFWLGSPMLAIVPILYMAWGDMVTGLIRSKIYGKEVKGNWGTLGMLITCLLIAFLYPVYWIAAIGALVGTLSERYTPLSKGLWDDNWSIIVFSLVVMAPLSMLS